MSNATPAYTPKQRMLNAYRGEYSDRAPVAPEFWYYYPAKLLGVDMIEFQREVPFHQALQRTFEAFDCEGWGIGFAPIGNDQVTAEGAERWISDTRLETRSTIHTPRGDLTCASLLDREEPGWVTERLIKEPERDLPAFEMHALPDPENTDVAPLVRAWEEVGESYLLEAMVGVPFVDFYGGNREGALETTIFDLWDHRDLLKGLQERFIDHMVGRTRVICERTPVESFFIGCSWSCNSLISPAIWREWDKPVIEAVAKEAHAHGRLLHIHFHGRCLETVADFAELELDCVCPFERPPGGDVEGLAGLREVARILADKVTMNGNIHTVETLIRGTEDDVRREVGEVWEAFKHTPRVIFGTGDQVGRETPEENLHAMINEAKRLSARQQGTEAT